MVSHGPAGASLGALGLTFGVGLLLVLMVGPPAFVAPHGGAHIGALDRTIGPSSASLPSTHSRAAIATDLPDWINVTTPSAATPPPIGLGAAMAYDPLVGAYVYFGGCTTSACPTNQTWLYSGGHWQNVTTPRDSPPIRTDASMDFDANAGGVLLFGGVGTLGPLNDTWVWSAHGWTNETALSGVAPMARNGASLAFDPANDTNGTVLFGGYGATSALLNDTWLWQPGSGWVQLNPTLAPPPRELAQMAYDANLGGLVLFSGDQLCASGTCSTPDTWEWYGGSWWTVLGASSPPGRIGALFTADSSLGIVLLFGGYNVSTASYRSDTWEFGSTGWQSYAPAHHPSARIFPGAAPEAGAGAPLLYSGTNDYGVGPGTADTWVFEAPPTASVSPSANAEANAPVTFSITVTGGSAPYQSAVTFGDGTNGSIPSSGASGSLLHTYLVSGSYPVGVRVTDSMGATTGVNTSVSVLAGPSVRAVATPTGTDVGRPIQFTEVTLLRGVVPDQYFWNWEDGSSSSSANASHAFTSAGSHTVQLQLTDAAGGSSSSTVSVTINPLPATGIQWSPGAPKTGAPTVLSANRTGGTAPFSYAWLLGDGTSSNAPGPSHFYSHAGTYTVQLWLNDSAGASVHQSQSITVAAGPSPSSPTTNSTSAPPVPIWFWPGIGALIVVAAVGSFLLLRRARKPAGA